MIGLIHFSTIRYHESPSSMPDGSECWVEKTHTCGLLRKEETLYQPLSHQTGSSKASLSLAMLIWKATEIRCFKERPVRGSSCARQSILLRPVMDILTALVQKTVYFHGHWLKKSNHLLTIGDIFHCYVMLQPRWRSQVIWLKSFGFFSSSNFKPKIGDKE